MSEPSKVYKYFIVPYENVSKQPDYTVWFASWSTERPPLIPGAASPIVIGATAEGLPAGAILLGTGSKDPPPDPPPLAATNVSEYQAQFRTWLELNRGA